MMIKIILGFVCIISLIGLSVSAPSCVDPGPPYFLITFHDAPANVAKFTTTGCYMGMVLVNNPTFAKDSEFRGMAIHDSGYLFIAETSGTEDLSSSVAIYSDCQTSLGPVTNRVFQSYAIRTELNPGIVHPYGLAIESRSNPIDPHFMYVSSQHTDNIIRYFPQLETLYQPVPFPPAILNDMNVGDMFYGTFVQFGLPGIHNSSEQGVRGIALVPSLANASISDIWVANEDYEEIFVYSTVSGKQIDLFSTPNFNPISLYFDSTVNLLFIGCTPSNGKGDGIIYTVDIHTRAIVGKLQASPMNHPAGMVSIQDTLFVLEQENDHLLSFQISNSSYIGEIVNSFASYGFSPPEQIVLSSC